MKLFRRKSTVRKTYDPAEKRPEIHCSICNGEQVAGFRDVTTGRFEEVMLIRDETDLDRFRTEYGISESIRREY